MLSVTTLAPIQRQSVDKINEEVMCSSGVEWSRWWEGVCISRSDEAQGYVYVAYNVRDTVATHTSSPPEHTYW